MLKSCAECLDQARTLSAAAESLEAGAHRARLLRMAEAWLDLAQLAEVQDQLAEIMNELIRAAGGEGACGAGD